MYGMPRAQDAQERLVTGDWWFMYRMYGMPRAQDAQERLVIGGYWYVVNSIILYSGFSLLTLYW